MKCRSFTLFTFLGLLSACTLTSTSPTEQGPKQALGTVTGMVIGGKIANDLTKDSSKNNLWTLAGVTLGAFLGNEIGASMDKTDILMAQNARSYALENNKINSQAAWTNPDSGNSGVIYPTFIPKPSKIGAIQFASLLAKYSFAVTTMTLFPVRALR